MIEKALLIIAIIIILLAILWLYSLRPGPGTPVIIEPPPGVTGDFTLEVK